MRADSMFSETGLDSRLLIIPVLFVMIGIAYMLFMKSSASRNIDRYRKAMKDFALQQYPDLQGNVFSLVSLLDPSLTPEHDWLIAYDASGMRIMPTSLDPVKMEINRYSKRYRYRLDKQVADDIGRAIYRIDTTEENEFVPRSSVTGAELDERKKILTVHIGDDVRHYKYSEKGVFGISQEESLNRFFKYLNAV